MGVLSARENAEKVGYQYIGEEVKEASNVIDYNINEEITKDTSAVFNANNDTTTGMATVIPGVNAPKLIDKTSIYGIDQNAGFQGSVQFRFYQYDSGYVTVPAGESMTFWIDRMTQKRNQVGPYDFKYLQGRGMIIPSTGTYTVGIVYARTGDGGGINSYLEGLLNGEVVYTTTRSSSGELNDTFTIYPHQYDSLMFRVTFENTAATNKQCCYILWVNLTKQ